MRKWTVVILFLLLSSLAAGCESGYENIDESDQYYRVAERN